MFALFARGDIISATEVVQRLIKVADRVGTSRARGSIYWNAAIVAHGARRARRGDPAHRPRCSAAQRGGGEQRPPPAAPPLRLAAAAPRLPRRRRGARPARPGRRRTPPCAARSWTRASSPRCAVAPTWCWAQLDDAAEQAANALQLLGPSEHIDRTEALILLGDVGAARFEEDLADESYREARTVLAGMTIVPRRRAALAPARRQPAPHRRPAGRAARLRRVADDCRHAADAAHESRSRRCRLTR